MRSVVIATALLLTTSCQSAEERAIDAAIEEQVGRSDFQIAELGTPFIYRSSFDARMACLPIRLKNQWGEVQPEQRAFAFYKPSVDQWLFDSIRPAEDGLTCEQHLDPQRIAAERASQAAAQQSRMAEIARRQAEDNAEWQQRAAQQEKAQQEQYEHQQRESSATQAQQESAREAEYRRLQKESDAALQRSLENGPTNE